MQDQCQAQAFQPDFGRGAKSEWCPHVLDLAPGLLPFMSHQELRICYRVCGHHSGSALFSNTSHAKAFKQNQEVDESLAAEVASSDLQQLQSASVLLKIVCRQTVQTQSICIR